MDARRRSRPAPWLALSLLAAVAGPAPALDPDKAFHQLRLDAWGPEDGMPQASTLAIVQTADGYLWLGGYQGLDRFDGVRFTTFDAGNTPGLRDNNVFALAEAEDGALWIGTDGGGLTRYAGGRFTAFTTADGLVDDRVVLAGRDGGLWIGTKGGLGRFDDDGLRAFTVADGLPDAYVATLAEDADGSLWIGTENGLARYRGGAFEVFSTADGLGAADVAALAVDRGGTLWIGLYGAPLARYRDGAFAPVAGAELAHDVVSFYEDRDGTLWMGTYGRGLLRLAGGRLTAHSLADGLTSDLIWSIAEDREGNLWLGSEGGGLMRLKDGPVTPLTRRDGLPHDRILSVCEDAGGALWIGTDGGGLARLSGGAVSVWGTEQGLPSNIVDTVFPRRDGSVWIGTTNGLRQLRDGRVRADFDAEIGPTVPVKALFEDRRGRMWIGTDGSGLVAVEGATVRAYSRAEGLPGDGVRVIFEDRDGVLWIGADGGLARFADGRIHDVSGAAGLDGAFVRAIHQDPDGGLWIGTRGRGLTLLRGGEATTFTTRDGLFSDVVYAILEDAVGNLWMSCNQGIFRIARSALEALARGETAAVRSVAYGAAEGMPTSDSAGGSQPAGWKSRDGRLWFATSRGLAVIDPSRLEPNPLPPPVYVERVLADGEAVGAAASTAAPPQLTLPPGKGELEFHYTALSLTAPEKVRFRYRLEGWDDHWIDAGARRSAYYTNMPPGSYRFRVIAANNDGVWNETGAAVELYLRPAFYQRRVFYLACLAAAALLARGLYRLRLRALMRRNAELEEIRRQLEAKNAEIEATNAEVERFTYAVSHDLKSPLVTVLGFLGFLERDLAKGDAARVATDVERMRSAATKMQRLIDELLELSRLGRRAAPAEPVDLGDLAREAVELVGGRIAARGVEVAVAPDLPAVLGDRARLLQVLQNLLDNAVKFMGDQAAPRVEVGAAGGAAGDGEVVCFVRDNGAGIEPRYQEQVFGLFDQLDAGAEGFGMGLAMVRRILETHGGRIWVESAGEGAGSTFYFALPAA